MKKVVKHNKNTFYKEWMLRGGNSIWVTKVTHRNAAVIIKFLLKVEHDASVKGLARVPRVSFSQIALATDINIKQVTNTCIKMAVRVKSPMLVIQTKGKRVGNLWFPEHQVSIRHFD